MDEWESKIEMLAKIAIYEDVTSISGVPTWTLILTCKTYTGNHRKSTLKKKYGHTWNYTFTAVFHFSPGTIQKTDWRWYTLPGNL